MMLGDRCRFFRFVLARLFFSLLVLAALVAFLELLQALTDMNPTRANAATNRTQMRAKRFILAKPVGGCARRLVPS